MAFKCYLGHEHISTNSAEDCERNSYQFLSPDRQPMNNPDLKFSSPESGKIKLSDVSDECEVTIPNPRGGRSAVLIIKREQIAQYADDKLDAAEFNFVFKLTEEQMMDMQEQWRAKKSK